MSLLVALDLGGVLADVDHGAAMRRLGIDRPALERAFFDGGLHDAVTVGGVDGEVFVRTAAERLGVSAAEVRAAWADVVRVTAEGRRLVEDLLRRGVMVHLWSNTDPIHLLRMAAELPEGARAATVSFRVGAMKPDPGYYERARAAGEPVVFLDDLEKNVAAARVAGVEARLCRGPAEARAALVALGLL